MHPCSNHAFAEDSDGDIWAWGLNDFLQTGVVEGDGKRIDNPIILPQKVEVLKGLGVYKIVGGDSYTLVQTYDGLCYGMGNVRNGRLGMSPYEFEEEDVYSDDAVGRLCTLRPKLLPIDNVVDIAAGVRHSAIITGNGEAYVFGSNSHHQCGANRHDEDIAGLTMIEPQTFQNRPVWTIQCGENFTVFGVKAGDL